MEKAIDGIESLFESPKQKLTGKMAWTQQQNKLSPLFIFNAFANGNFFKFAIVLLKLLWSSLMIPTLC